MSSIEERLDVEFAPAWRPDAGDKLAGEVVGIGERAGEFGTYPIVTLRRDDGEEFAMHAFQTVLASQLAALRPKLGDRVAVKYLGRQSNAAGTGSYHAYRAVNDGGDQQSVDWSKYGDAEKAEGGSDLSSIVAAEPGDDSIPF